ncbi:hypothetical protein VNI00_013161 [Paramarasmius palmivorus]|uniref:Uncharacterized protein n=1 Tax=Paramarasmius palmivorus TaxID=297713 RepID=A0AAW0C094_9AGAR
MPVSFYPAQHPANPIQLSKETIEKTTSLSILRDAAYDQYQKAGEILQSSFRSGEPILARSNGLVNGLSDAYNYHRAISIRPDDVWITILTQFSFFVNANAEQLRAQFVEHKGQKKLRVETEGTRYTVDFGLLARMMTGELRRNVKDSSLCDWILPDFSTTTLNDTVVSSVVMMATLQKYFSYEFGLTCGIPKVTLEGEKADWEKLLARIDKLKEYGDETTRWENLLRPVLSRFVSAFDTPNSQENLDFWQRVAHFDGGGSGPTYVCGWMTAFCVFGADGKWLGDQADTEIPEPATSLKDMHNMLARWQSNLVLDGVHYHALDSEDIPAAYASVPVTLDDNGDIFDTIMVAGMVGLRVSESGDPSLTVFRSQAADSPSGDARNTRTKTARARPKLGQILASVPKVFRRSQTAEVPTEPSGSDGPPPKQTGDMPPESTPERGEARYDTIQPVPGWWIFVKMYKKPYDT